MNSLKKEETFEKSRAFYLSGVTGTRSRSHEVLRGKQSRLKPEKEIIVSKMLRELFDVKLINT